MTTSRHLISFGELADARPSDPGAALLSTPLWLLLADRPELRPILDRFGLDTCCGGHLTLVEAAAEHGLDPHLVAAAMNAASAPDPQGS